MGGESAGTRSGATAGSQAAWDRVAAAYESYWLPRLLPYQERAVALVQPANRGPLAVPGCGPGQEVLLLHRRFPDRVILATDPAPAMLARLRERLRQADTGRVLATEGAAESLSGSILQAAGVLSCFALQLLSDPGAALADWARALAPHACATVLFWPLPRPESVHGRIAAAVQSTLGESRPDWENAVRGRLAALGLKLVHEETCAHEMRHASPEVYFDRLVDAGPLQGLLARHGRPALDRCRAVWLRDSGFDRRAGEVAHRPEARLWVLEATGAPAAGH